MDMQQENLSPAELGCDTNTNEEEFEFETQHQKEEPCPSGPPVDHYQPSGQRLSKKELLDRLSYADQRAWSSVRRRSLVALPLPVAIERRMRQWFELVDGDGSGQLNPAEVEFALKASGINANTNTVADFIKLFDINRDGKIAWREFISLLSYKHRQVSSPRHAVRDDYELPIGVTLPIGSMMDVLRRRKILDDIEKGGLQREFWAAEGPEFLRYLLESEKYDFDEESREVVRRISDYKPPANRVEGESPIAPKAAEEHKHRIQRLKQALLRNMAGSGGNAAAHRHASSSSRARASVGPESPFGSATTSTNRRSIDVSWLQGGGNNGAGSRASRVLRAACFFRKETADGTCRFPTTASEEAAVEPGTEADAARDGNLNVEISASSMADGGGDSVGGGNGYSWLLTMEEQLAARASSRFPTQLMTAEDKGAIPSPLSKCCPCNSGRSSPVLCDRDSPCSASLSSAVPRTAQTDDTPIHGDASIDGTPNATVSAGAASGVWSAISSGPTPSSTAAGAGFAQGTALDGHKGSGSGWVATRRLPVLGPGRELTAVDAARDSALLMPDTIEPLSHWDHNKHNEPGSSNCNSNRDTKSPLREGTGVNGDTGGNGTDNNNQSHDYCDDDGNIELVQDEVVYVADSAATTPTPGTPEGCSYERTVQRAPSAVAQRRPMSSTTHGPYTSRMIRAARSSRQLTLSPPRTVSAGPDSSGSTVSLERACLTVSGTPAIAVSRRCSGSGSESSRRFRSSAVPHTPVSASGTSGASGAGNQNGMVPGTGPGVLSNIVNAGNIYMKTAMGGRFNGASHQQSPIETASQLRAEVARLLGNGRADKVADEIRRNVWESASHNHTAQHQHCHQQQQRGIWPSPPRGLRPISPHGSQAGSQDPMPFEQLLSSPQFQRQQRPSEIDVAAATPAAGGGVVERFSPTTANRTMQGGGGGGFPRPFSASQRSDMVLKPTQASSYMSSFGAGARSSSPVPTSPGTWMASATPSRMAIQQTAMLPSRPMSPKASPVDRVTAREGLYLPGRRSLDSELRPPSWRIHSAARAPSPVPNSQLWLRGLGPFQQQQHRQHQPAGPGFREHPMLQILPTQQQLDVTTVTGDLRTPGSPSAAVAIQGPQIDKNVLLRGTRQAITLEGSANTAFPIANGVVFTESTVSGSAFPSPPACTFMSGTAVTAANASGGSKHTVAEDVKKWPWPWKRELAGDVAVSSTSNATVTVGKSSGGSAFGSFGGDGFGRGSKQQCTSIAATSPSAPRICSSFMKWS